jgi:XTP/dITP diphosphohydrolase
VIRLLVATYNRGKLAEFKDLLSDAPVQVVGPHDLRLSLTVAETGSSYADNARFKAEGFVRASGEMALADDSGLEVDALNGEPGLHSARYAGPAASDVDRYRLLLNRLSGVPWERRTARFRCVLVLATPSGAVHTVEGVCEGLIAREPHGDNGFGYDPVFFLSEQGCTMAQLESRAKNQISHRANAVTAMLPILLRYAATGEGDGRADPRASRAG